MSNTNTGGPAFPTPEKRGFNHGEPGMTLRQYAAIQLKVPDSGEEWLDEMIRKSLLDNFAAKAMQATYQVVQKMGKCVLYSEMAKDAYIVAHAMLKASAE